MQLAHQSDEGHHAVRRLGAGFVQVGDRVFSASLLLAPDRCIDDFAPHSLDEFDAAAIAAVLALEPTVVLIGTGERQRLAPPALMAAFLARGITLELTGEANDRQRLRLWSELQGGAPPRRGLRDLQRQAPQAAAGLSGPFALSEQGF